MSLLMVFKLDRVENSAPPALCRLVGRKVLSVYSTLSISVILRVLYLTPDRILVTMCNLIDIVQMTPVPTRNPLIYIPTMPGPSKVIGLS